MLPEVSEIMIFLLKKVLAANASMSRNVKRTNQMNTGRQDETLVDIFWSKSEEGGK